MYRSHLSHFRDFVRPGKEPLIKTDDAVKTLELALRIRSSFES